MANFFSGMIRGGVLAAVALATASVLLPARPKLPPVDVAQTADPAAVSVDPAEGTAAAKPKVTLQEAAPKELPQQKAAPQVAVQQEVAQQEVVQIAPKQPAAPAQTAPSTSVPAKSSAVETPAPSVTKEALLDPSEDMAAAKSNATGAKVVAPPAEVSPKIANDTIAATSQSIATAQTQALQPVAPVTSAPAVNAPPLQKYASTFDYTGKKPLFAVILRDTGAKDLDRAALAALPFPVTFAIDPDAENAKEAMAIYRAAGKEVVMLTAGLPNGATAQDLEQAFQTYETILPETVAVMGPAEGGFQDNAVLSQLIVPVIAAQGRGLITFDRGLNAAAQNAAREGVANGTVFRQVDGGGESVPVIRRYLDRAVFKAAQDGSAIVMGETLPDTITALTEWSLEGRATDVTLAPISAVLR